MSLFDALSIPIVLRLSNRTTSPEKLKKLAEHKHSYVRMNVALNKYTPADTLKKLAKAKNTDIHKFVARNPNTPVETLKKLAQNPDESIRRDVANNKKVPSSILQLLSKDDNYYVRLQVATNKNIQLPLMRELAKDDIRGAIQVVIIKNSKIDVDLLLYILDYIRSIPEPNEFVIKHLYKHPLLPIFAKRIIETLFGEMLT